MLQKDGGNCTSYLKNTNDTSNIVDIYTRENGRASFSCVCSPVSTENRR